MHFWVGLCVVVEAFGSSAPSGQWFHAVGGDEAGAVASLTSASGVTEHSTSGAREEDEEAAAAAPAAPAEADSSVLPRTTGIEKGNLTAVKPRARMRANWVRASASAVVGRRAAEGEGDDDEAGESPRSQPPVSAASKPGHDTALRSKGAPSEPSSKGPRVERGLPSPPKDSEEAAASPVEPPGWSGGEASCAAHEKISPTIAPSETGGGGLEIEGALLTMGGEAEAEADDSSTATSTTSLLISSEVAGEGVGSGAWRGVAVAELPASAASPETKMSLPSTPPSPSFPSAGGLRPLLVSAGVTGGIKGATGQVCGGVVVGAGGVVVGGGVGGRVVGGGVGGFVVGGGVVVVGGGGKVVGGGGVGLGLGGGGTGCVPLLFLYQGLRPTDSR